MTIDDLARALGDVSWLTEARAAVSADPTAIVAHFAAAGRHCGRAALPQAVLNLAGWSADDAARVLLLASLRRPAPDVVPVLLELYHHGDRAERRAVLRALPMLPVAAECVELLHDALRTNDPDLVAAAMGPYSRHLGDAAWRQAVLKCVFMGIPLAGIDDLAGRADAELAVMLGSLARERAAAGRTIPDDALALLDRLT